MADDPSAVGGKAAGNVLTKKVGPLPVWGWAAVVIGAYLVYRYIKDKNAASASSSTGTSTGADTTASQANGIFGSEGFGVNSAGQIVDTATGTVVGSTGNGAGTTSTSGQDWASSAYQALQGLGYGNAQIDQTLQDYISGQKLSASEYATVEAAINLIGNAPD